MTILQRSSGTFTTSSVLITPQNAAFGTGTTIVAAFFGNTVFNTLTGWTLRASSVDVMGLYAFDTTGNGESSFTFTTTVAGGGEWYVWELSAGSTWLNGSAAQDTVTSSGYVTPAITPTAGNRHALAVAGGNSGSARTIDAWSDGFVEWADAQVLSNDFTFSAAADVNVAADGLTAYSTTATFSGSVTTRGGMTLLYDNVAVPEAQGVGVGPRPVLYLPRRGAFLR